MTDKVTKPNYHPDRTNLQWNTVNNSESQYTIARPKLQNSKKESTKLTQVLETPDIRVTGEVLAPSSKMPV